MNQQSIRLVPGTMLLVQPSLAKAIGLNEAIFLQQVHYWISRHPHHHEGRSWIYNTYENWKQQFPFWSIRTIRRIVLNLRKKKLIETTTNYNPRVSDKMLWYSINYDMISAIEIEVKNDDNDDFDPWSDCQNMGPDCQNLGTSWQNMGPDCQNLGTSWQNMRPDCQKPAATLSKPAAILSKHAVKLSEQAATLSACSDNLDGCSDNLSNQPDNVDVSSIYKRLTTETNTEITTTTTDPRDRALQDDPEEVVVVVSQPPEVVVVSHPPEVVQLIEIGIPEPKAVGFFNSRGPAYIQEKMEILHSQPEVRYPSRWLLAALEKDFQRENYVRPDSAEQERQNFAEQIAAEQQAYETQEAARLAKAQQAEIEHFQALHNQHGISRYHFDCWKKGLGYCKDFVFKGNQFFTQALESTILLAFSDNHARIGVLDGAVMFQLQQRGRQFLQEAIAYAMRDELQRAKITYELEQL